MKRSLKVWSVVSILYASSTFGVGQQTSISPPTRSVMVSVVDIHGKAVRELDKEDFHLSLDGKSASVVDAQHSLAPRRIVVLLDMSGSMNGEAPLNQKWQIASEALRDLLVQTPSEVPIAMLTFSSQIKDRFGFQEGRATIDKWLNEHPDQPPRVAHRRTALLDAVLEALQLLRPFQPGDALYAITDGEENASRTSAAQVRSQLLSSGVRVFAFLFAEPAVGNEEQENETAFLNIVESSGGFAFGIHGHPKLGGPAWKFDYTEDKKNKDLVKAYAQELNVLVHEFWTLEFVSPLSSKDSRIRLEITDKDGRKRKDIYLVYPHFIPAVKQNRG